MVVYLNPTTASMGNAQDLLVSQASEPQKRISVDDLAKVYRSQGLMDESMQVCEAFMGMLKLTSRNEHTSLSGSLDAANFTIQLAQLYEDQAIIDQAEELYRLAVSIVCEVWEDEETPVLLTSQALCSFLKKHRTQDAAAQEEARRLDADLAASYLKRWLGDDHPYVLTPGALNVRLS